MDLPALLKARKEELGLSHRTAGKFFGVDRQTFRNWEKGASIPAQERLRQIAQFLDMPYGWVLCGLGILSEDEAVKLAQGEARGGGAAHAAGESSLQERREPGLWAVASDTPRAA